MPEITYLMQHRDIAFLFPVNKVSLDTVLSFISFNFIAEPTVGTNYTVAITINSRCSRLQI